MGYEDENAITFSLMDGKLITATHADLTPEMKYGWTTNPGKMTHYKMACIKLYPKRVQDICKEICDIRLRNRWQRVEDPHLVKDIGKLPPEMERDRVQWANLQAELEEMQDGASADLSYNGRAWKVGNELFVSFWGTIGTPGSVHYNKIATIARELMTMVGVSDEADVHLQDEGMSDSPDDGEADSKWVPLGTKGSTMRPDTEAAIRKLSSGLHAATPEQKAQIKAEIAKIKKDAGLAPEPEADAQRGWGAALAGRRAAAAGMAPAAFNAMLRDGD